MERCDPDTPNRRSLGSTYSNPAWLCAHARKRSRTTSANLLPSWGAASMVPRAPLVADARETRTGLCSSALGPRLAGGATHAQAACRVVPALDLLVRRVQP